VLSARPMVAILARYASRFSVRALDLTVDSSMLWVGAAGGGRGGAAGVCAAPAVGRRANAWIQPVERQRADHRQHQRRQRVFAVTQIAASFVLLAGASMLLKTLLALQAAQTGFDTRHVLAINVPVMSYGKDARSGRRFLQGNDPAHHVAGRGRRGGGHASRGATRATSAPASNSRPTATSARRAKKIRARNSASSRPDFSRRSACPMIAGRDFNDPTAKTASRWSS
jgi:putative ABC transport system permease protein